MRIAKMANAATGALHKKGMGAFTLKYVLKIPAMLILRI